MSKVLGLRTVKPDMTSHKGFVWPESGPVEAPDWVADDKCGHGLHFLLPGQNTPGKWYSNGKWLILEVEDGDYRAGEGELSGKAKCRCCVVVHCGDRDSAMRYLAEHRSGGPWYYGTATAGDFGTATAGHFGTATAGHCGTATASHYGTATAGHFGTVTAGHHGTATAGYGGIITIKHWDGHRERLVTGYVGEDGIEANVPYILRDGKFVKKETTDE